MLQGSPPASLASGEANVQEAGMRGGQQGGVTGTRPLLGQLKS